MIEKILKRTSTRYYRNKKIEANKIKKLKEVINSSPTSMNEQCFSAIFISNENIKKKIATLNWNQKHIYECPLLIIFLADFNRVNLALKKFKQKNKISNDETLMLSSIDASIAASFACLAAMEMNLDTCFIGGVRNYADQLKKMLNFSGQCTPIVGLTIGYKSKEIPIRPKINKCYNESYSLNIIKKELEKYDDKTKKYYQKIFKKDLNYSLATIEALKKIDDTRREQIIKKQFNNI